MRDGAANHSSVTVIGLGLMGQSLADALLRDGHQTTVWNRTSAKADRLVAAGATRADSASDAVAASPLVVVCVSDYDAVREILDPLEGFFEGRVLVNLTSGTSFDARETAEWVARRAGSYLDGAILAAPAAIGTTDAAILYSGSSAAFDQHEATLRSLGVGTYLGDDHRLSSLYDAAVLGLMWGTLDGFLHGAALLRNAGVDGASFTPLLVQSIGTVASWLPAFGKQIDEGAYPGVDATIDTHVAAMEHLLEESRSLGVSTQLPRFVKSLADQAVVDGFGDNGYAAMIEQFRKASPED